MQKKLKWGLIPVLVVLVMIGSISCSSSGSSETNQLAQVTRGDVTSNVSGSGSIQLIDENNLTFGVGGKVAQLLVKEGDEVSKGQVLAKLETDTLELALSQAEMSQTNAQIAVVQAQAAIVQAQLAQQTAAYDLDKAQNTYQWPALEVAQADVETARNAVKYAQYRIDNATTGQDRADWTRLEMVAELNLTQAGNKLSAMLTGADPDEVAIKKLQLEVANQSVELTQQAVAPAEQAVKLAELSLQQAQKQLNEATITAPYAGVVTDVYVDEGDIIPPPSLAAKAIIHLVDLSSMELVVSIDELDIPGVTLGQRAVISVDALPNVSLEGKVSYISPMPTTAAGVVGYEAKVSFTPPKGLGLRAGMSASADIITAQSKNVLLIPDRAIKRDSQGKATVEVTLNGQIEVRAIVTGVSDGSQTEIIKGLSEGEQVVEKQTAAKPSGSSLLFGG